MIDPSTFHRRTIASLVITSTMLMAGVVRLPAGWALTARETIQSTEPRSNVPGGYYEGLIGGGSHGDRGAQTPLELALMGNPIAHNRGQVKEVIRDRKGDFLQFDLKPGFRAEFFGQPYSTNMQGLRDRDYAVEKPDGVYRIALLGASIDMGWGIADGATYENRLEDWLNAEATRRKISRRFEVINFAVPAYGPVQRYDVFRHKALAYRPDLVLFASTMLDARLVEIHLGGLIKNKVDLKYDFFQRATTEAGIDIARERVSGWGSYKDLVKENYWIFADVVLGHLAADCRSEGIALVGLLIPRASRDEASKDRVLAAARQAGIAARHAVPLIDLSGSFDQVPPARVQIAPGDDHPNALGHQLLFEGLRQGLLNNPAPAGDLFDPPR